MRAQRGLSGVGLMVAVVLSLAGGWFGKRVSVGDQWPIFDGLRTTAGIVFTVVGIWLALIYPEVLQALASWRQGFRKQAPRIARLSEPLVESAVVVAVVSLIALFHPLLSRLPVRPEQVPPIRGASFAVLVALTILQLRSLWASVSPLFDLGLRIADQEEHARVRGKFPEPRPSGPQPRESARANQA
ncbi:MAG: hypothetical protein ACREOQ_17820 [Gemmatimonadales bacterium]